MGYVGYSASASGAEVEPAAVSVFVGSVFAGSEGACVAAGMVPSLLLTDILDYCCRCGYRLLSFTKEMLASYVFFTQR